MVVNAWPSLSEGDRKAVLAIIREAAAIRRAIVVLPQPEGPERK